MRIFPVIILAVLLLAGCSVGMALYGHSEPDLRNIQVGKDRKEVESYLGKPVKTKTEDWRTIAVYKYQVGNEPAPARAGMHAILDVGTLGLWEFIGTPIELIKGSTRRLTVIYGPDNKVVEIKKGG
ncbi:MAG: hypothetical protein HY790_08135 [Deltaproteobacteria bacterium]|nr:hypothetical protein [Deltaproteobacteria bacterium]MBI4795786.1 hypothetical protein [Deltaproteobacteria bacterium]